MRARVIIYTDGSALGNPGPGGYGALVVRQKDGKREETTLQAGYRLSTNNRMELLALIRALGCLKEGVDKEVSVYTDSQYVAFAIQKQWLVSWQAKGFKKVKNTDLWKLYLEVSAALSLRHALDTRTCRPQGK